MRTMPDPAHPQPVSRQVWLVAVLGALLALLVAWQTGVPLTPGAIAHLPFAAGLLLTAALGVFLHGTAPGNALRWFLANTNWGQFVLLVAALLLLFYFQRVHDVAYAAELASAILGASVGSLARLAVL